MQYKAIVWSSLKKQPQFQIKEAEGKTIRSYYKVNGKIVEYVQIESLEQLEEELTEKKRILFLTDKIEEIPKQELSHIHKNCSGVFHLTNENYGDIEVFLHMMMKQQENREKKSDITMLGGFGQSIGTILIDILRKFKYMEDSIKVNLLLFVPREIDLEEISQIEDALKEYLKESCMLEIEQYEYEKKEYYYLLSKI